MLYFPTITAKEELGPVALSWSGFVIVDNSLNTSFIYSPLVEDLTIQAGSTGSANVEFVANKVIINDLSVNQVNANSINLNIAVSA